MFQPGFFAREDTATPMRYAMINMAANTAGAIGLFYLFQRLGWRPYLGIAIATSLAGWLNALMLWATLVKRGHFKADARLWRVLPLILLLPLRRMARGSAEWRRTRQQAASAMGSAWTLSRAMRTGAFWGILAAYFFTSVASFSVAPHIVAYLVEQGGPLLWLFTVLALSAWAGARSARRAMVVAAVIALALPASLQFAWKKARLPYDPVPAEMVRAMDALAAASAPGDVVLQRPGARYPPLPVVLIGRRVPYERFTPWLTQFAPRQALEQRHEMVFRFFRTHDRAEAMAIASALDARFVALYGPDRLRFDTTGALEPIYEGGGVRLLRVTSAAAPASPSSPPSPPAR